MSSCGMRLAGEDDLHRPAGRVQDPREPLRIAEHQLGALVAGEAPREADRHRVGIEQRAGRDDARGADALLDPPLPRPLADEGKEIAPQSLTDGPQLLVGNREDAFPQRRIVVPIEPVGAEVGGEQVGEVRGDPGRHVDAVGDVRDRTVRLRHVRPHRRKHRARHRAVQPADRVGRSGGADGQGGHVEQHAAAVVVGPEREKPFAVGAERPPAAGQVRFDHAERKRVVARRHRRVGGEHRGAADLLERGVERGSLFDQIADALEDDEAGVSFVQVEHAGIDAERLQRADAADAEDDLLLDARFAIAAVQPRGQLAVPRRVFLQARCPGGRA